MKVYVGSINFTLKVKAIVLLIFRKVSCLDQIMLAVFSNWAIHMFQRKIFPNYYFLLRITILAKQSRNFFSPHSIVVFEIIML